MNEISSYLNINYLTHQKKHDKLCSEETFLTLIGLRISVFEKKGCEFHKKNKIMVEFQIYKYNHCTGFHFVGGRGGGEELVP